MLDDFGNELYVEVMKLFSHHYTKEGMRLIFVHSRDKDSGMAHVEYKIVNEKEFEELAKRRKP